LTLDEDVYMPYQVAIDEAQNLIYVGAEAPPIPDPIKVAGKPFSCKAIHEMPDDEYDCWNPGSVFVIDGKTNKIVGSFKAGDDPEGVVFVAATGKVYASNEDDGSVTVAKGAIRNKNGSITPAKVIGTIIKGKRVTGWWQPTCDANNYCGERGQAALWPTKSTCNGIDDEAEEADKMTVGPLGYVYIIDDRYRVARINGLLDKVDKVLAIPGYDCEVEVPDGSNVVLRNTANNIAFGAFRVKVPGTHLYVPVLRVFVTSEQNTISLIDPLLMTLSQIITVEGAGELDAITADPARNSVFITDEELSALWVLQGK
jgi:DNA-binding beta-propeller fold protein YncE